MGGTLALDLSAPSEQSGRKHTPPFEALGGLCASRLSDVSTPQEEMLSWLQGMSTAINESQSIRVKAQSLPLPSLAAPDASLGKKDKEKRFSFFPKKK